MDAGGKEQVADHGDNEHRQAAVDQGLVPAAVDDLLGGQLGNQHACHQENVEIGQHAGEALFLGQDGGIGDHGAVGNHQEHHVEHEGQSRGIDGIPQGELFRCTLGYWMRQQDTQMKAATVMPKMVRKEALLLR